jgi:hypothetical protein
MSPNARQFSLNRPEQSRSRSSSPPGRSSSISPFPYSFAFVSAAPYPANLSPRALSQHYGGLAESSSPGSQAVKVSCTSMGGASPGKNKGVVVVNKAGAAPQSDPHKGVAAAPTAHKPASTWGTPAASQGHPHAQPSSHAHQSVPQADHAAPSTGRLGTYASLHVSPKPAVASPVTPNNNASAHPQSYSTHMGQLHGASVSSVKSAAHSGTPGVMSVPKPGSSSTNKPGNVPPIPQFVMVSSPPHPSPPRTPSQSHAGNHNQPPQIQSPRPQGTAGSQAHVPMSPRGMHPPGMQTGAAGMHAYMTPTQAAAAHTSNNYNNTNTNMHSVPISMSYPMLPARRPSPSPGRGPNETLSPLSVSALSSSPHSRDPSLSPVKVPSAYTSQASNSIQVATAATRPSNAQSHHANHVLAQPQVNATTRSGPAHDRSPQVSTPHI